MSRGCVAMPGAFNAATARLIEQTGFEAVYVSGAGLSNATAGVPDIGLLSRAEVAALAGYVAAAVDIPALVDADTGFDGTGETLKRFTQAGLAGMQIEDQVSAKRCGHLSGKRLISATAMTAKIESAVKARGRGSFVIVARTDARSVEGFDSALERAQSLSRCRGRRDFPRSAGNRGGVCRVRPADSRSSPGKHDRIRKVTAAGCRTVKTDGVSACDISADGVSCGDEGAGVGVARTS